MNPTPKKKVGRMQIVPRWPQPVAAREPCEQSPESRGETARPETLGIEAQTIDTQGTGFNSSETSKDAEMPVRNSEGPRIHVLAYGRSL